MAVTDDPPCQAEACAIQDCLMAKNYQEEKCYNVIDQLYECCDKMYKNQLGKSTACPKPKVVEKKLKDKEERARGKR